MHVAGKHLSTVTRNINILTVQKDDFIAYTSTANGSRCRASLHFDVLLYQEGGPFTQVEDYSTEEMQILRLSPVARIYDECMLRFEYKMRDWH